MSVSSAESRCETPPTCSSIRWMLPESELTCLSSLLSCAFERASCCCTRASFASTARFLPWMSFAAAGAATTSASNGSSRRAIGPRFGAACAPPAQLLVAGIRRGRRRRALVRRRIRLGDLGRLRQIRLVRRRIGSARLVGSDHHGVLYRKTGAANPLLRVGEVRGELALDAFALGVELAQPLPRLLLAARVAVPDGGAERLQRGPPLALEPLELGALPPARERGVEPGPPHLRRGRRLRAPIGGGPGGAIGPALAAAAARHLR